MSTFRNATINPICAACQEPIGDMPIDIYIKAVEYRGDHLLCPDCRTHKCDCCGWFLPGQVMRSVLDFDEDYIGNACEACFQWVLPANPTRDHFPHFLLCQKLNLVYVRYSYENGERVPSLVVEELGYGDDIERTAHYEIGVGWPKEEINAL